MTSKLRPIIAVCNPQRVIAALVFIPLLAYAFPPFMVSELSFILRVLFWIGVMILALSVTWLAQNMIRKHLHAFHLSLRDLAFVATILALFIPSLWLLAWMLFTLAGHSAPGMVTVAPYGVLFAAGLVLVQRDKRIAAEETPAPVAKPRLINRLPGSFQGDIYRLTVRDHNVDVVTSDGTYTIRSRFTDAIDQMEPVPGHCTHRSHWVTDAAITGTEKSGGKIHLRLKNGDLVPVSRKYRPFLEQDGLI